MTKFAYPLAWPDGWPKTKTPWTGSPYKVGGGQSLRDLERSLKLLGVGARATVSMNVPLNSAGRPYSEELERKGALTGGSGVAIYWTRAGVDQSIACDRYFAIGSNIRALWSALEGLRAMERSGAGQVVERIYSGFARLPSGEGAAAAAPPPKPRRPWWQVLGWEMDPLTTGMSAALTLVAAEAMFKSLSRTAHPDAAGGSHEAFIEINEAIAEARRVIT